jgi:hypothetical protein
MGAGKLNLTGGADRLMEGDFSYNVSDWKPKVGYDISDKKGELVVKQGSAKGARLGAGARNEWDIRLNDEVSTDLVVQMGAGESDLDLDSLTLRGLNLQMGRARPRWISRATTPRASTPAYRAGWGRPRCCFRARLG